MLDEVLTTLFLVVMFGLGILVGLVAVLLSNDIKPIFVVFIAIAYLAAVFGICFMLLSQVPKLIDAKLNRVSETSRMAEPEQLYAQDTLQLEAHRQPAASVTEHTTRTLEHTPRSRD